VQVSLLLLRFHTLDHLEEQTQIPYWARDTKGKSAEVDKRPGAPHAANDDSSVVLGARTPMTGAVDTGTHAPRVGLASGADRARVTGSASIQAAAGDS